MDWKCKENETQGKLMASKRRPVRKGEERGGAETVAERAAGDSGRVASPRGAYLVGRSARANVPPQSVVAPSTIIVLLLPEEWLSPSVPRSTVSSGCGRRNAN